MQANKQQQKAIEWNMGPALILAGPGSGKTFTTVERVKYLIEVHHADPSHILVITFTKAAARQMRERFLKRMGGQPCPVSFGTFHAVFLHILKISRGYSAGSILREKEKREYLRTALSGLKGDFPMEREWEDSLLAQIGYVKNLGRLPENDLDCGMPKGQFARIFVEFQRLLHDAGKLDLDDFAAAVCHLLCTDPAELKRWQEQFSYILVDEFQDVNAAQYEAVRLLVGTSRNLFAVGDDDQAIYGFRGSDPAIMQRFVQDFPEAARIELSVNYRSKRGIVECAGRLVGVNKERFPKKIRAAQDGKADGVNSDADVVRHSEADAVRHSEADAVRKAAKALFGKKEETFEGGVWKSLAPDQSVWAGSFPDKKQEAKALVRMIKEMQAQGGKTETTAAIFRTNSDAVWLAAALEQAKIPFVMREKAKNPYDHPVCRDLLAYLRFSKSDRSRGQFLQIMNRPCRYLARQHVPAGQVDFTALKEAYRDKPYMQEILVRMQTDIMRIGRMDLYAAVNYVRKGIGYDNWLCREKSGKALEEAKAAADFLQESVRELRSMEQLEEHLEAYARALEKGGKETQGEEAGRKAADTGQEAAGSEQQSAGAGQGSGTIPVELITMHGSKGLEYDVVFLPGCCEGTVPHKKSASGRELEEERRMFYVGMTRAKKRLFLTWERGTKEAPGFASRFLYECGYREP